VSARYAARVRQTLFVFGLIALVSCDKDPVTNAPGEARGYKIDPVAYGENTRMDDKAREKCNFDAKLTSQVTQAIADKGTGQKTGDGKTLKLTIARVNGAETDWEGDITVLVDGVLHYHEVDEKHEFSAHGHAEGGLGGGMPGVCKGLDEIAGELADHIVEWLASPRHQAEIGDHPREGS
jgi:hypothetical protein